MVLPPGPRAATPLAPLRRRRRTDARPAGHRYAARADRPRKRQARPHPRGPLGSRSIMQHVELRTTDQPWSGVAAAVPPRVLRAQPLLDDSATRRLDIGVVSAT